MHDYSILHHVVVWRLAQTWSQGDLANVTVVFSDCTRLPENCSLWLWGQWSKTRHQSFPQRNGPKVTVFAVTVMRKLMQRSHTSSCDEDKIMCHSVRRVALRGQLFMIEHWQAETFPFGDISDVPSKHQSSWLSASTAAEYEDLWNDHVF